MHSSYYSSEKEQEEAELREAQLEAEAEKYDEWDEVLEKEEYDEEAPRG